MAAAAVASRLPGEERAVLAAAATVVASAVSALFSAAVLARWARARREERPAHRALLYWGGALALFCVASVAMAAGALTGWTPVRFRIFYLFGAVLTVPWLALGSVEIGAGRPAVRRAGGVAALVAGGLLAVPALTGDTPALFLPGAVLGAVWGLLLLLGGADGARAGSLALVVLLSAAGVLLLPSARFEAPIAAGWPESRDLLAPAVRGLGVAANTIGSAIVIVAAVASAVVLRRAGSRRLAAGNLLIAAGVLLAGAGGALSFLGRTAGNAIALALGVSVMYAGFVRAGARPDVGARRRGPAT